MTFSLHGLFLAWLLIIGVIALAIWISRHEVPRWVAPIVSLLTIVVSVSAYHAFGHFFPGLVDRALAVLLDNGSLLLLTSILLIVPLASAIWMIRTSTSMGVLAIYLTGVLLWTGLVFFPTRYFFEMVRFEQAVSSALNGEIDPDDQGRFDWECRWGCDDRAWLRDVPGVADVRCVQKLKNRGACCQAHFRDGIYTEIHPFKLANGRYKISFYSYPMCKNPDFVWPPRPDSPRIRQWVRCDERWRSSLDGAPSRGGAVSPL